MARRLKHFHTREPIMRWCLVLVLFLTLSSVAVAAKAAKIIAKKGPGGFSANGFGKKTATLSPTVKLNTGAEIPVLGFGTYRTGGPELQVALRHAIAAGYRHLDTASCYNNEAIVGAALKESGLPRESFFITTKLWCTDHGTERTRKAIKASLENLGTGYIDLYLIHAPWQLDIAKSPEEVSMLRRESWRVMEEFHRDGVLRALGVSNFEPRHIDDILACAGVKPAVNQVERHAYLAQTELREYCARHEILLEAYGSAGAKGLLEDPVVRAIAAAHGRTAAQVSLKYSVQRGIVVLAKSVTEKRIAQNAKLFDFELSEEDLSKLEALDCGQRSYWDNSNAP